MFLDRKACLSYLGELKDPDGLANIVVSDAKREKHEVMRHFNRSFSVFR